MLSLHTYRTLNGFLGCIFTVCQDVAPANIAERVAIEGQISEDSSLWKQERDMSK